VKAVLDFLFEYRFIILWIIMSIVSALIMGKEWVKAKAYSFMLLAKKLAKDKVLNTGEEQEYFVVEALYTLLKKLKIPFVTEEGLHKLVHKLYVKAMDYLDDGKFNNSVK
jgi:hypothetical protein